MSEHNYDYAHEGHIDIMFMKGENGVVHVRTPGDAEKELVDNVFEDITEHFDENAEDKAADLGDFALKGVIVGGTAGERVDTDTKRDSYNAHPPKPHKARK